MTEAGKISEVLLKKKLVACAKTFPVNSKFWWNGKIDNANEVLVSFETIKSRLEDIETEVLRLHSYQTPTIYSLSVQKTTSKVEKWLNDELN